MPPPSPTPQVNGTQLWRFGVDCNFAADSWSMKTPRTAEDRKTLGYVVGGLGMLAVALVLVPFRTDIDHANLALLLVVVVVLAAIVGDRSAAVLAAITATICFDFFLTRPYTSMRIESADDI